VVALKGKLDRTLQGGTPGPKRGRPEELSMASPEFAEGGPMPISVVMVDPHFWEASALFNPNAFPPHAKADASVCGDRLAILTHSVELVLREPGLNPSLMLQQLRENPAFSGFKPPPNKPSVIIFHNLNFLSGVYAALVSTKSLLDVYSRLIAKLLVPSASVFGFNSGRYDGRNLAGGKFLRWIERSAPKAFGKRDELVCALLRHVDDWIDHAVTYRDAIVHDGFIPGMCEAMIPFSDQVENLRQDDIMLPMMPNGQRVTDYCSALVRQVRSLTTETLTLLPSVDFKLLSLPEG
jgi:hypothetical protein